MISMFERLYDHLDQHRRDRAVRELYQRVFGTEDGKRVLADLLRRAGVTRPKMYQSDRVSAMHDGRESLAHEVLALAGVHHERLAEALVSDDFQEMSYERDRSITDGEPDAGDSIADTD